MSVIIKSRKQTFADDDTVFTDASTIPEEYSYQDTDPIPIIKPSDLVERYFLVNVPEDNQRISLKLGKALETRQDYLKDNPALKEFIVTSKDDTVKEIMS